MINRIQQKEKSQEKKTFPHRTIPVFFNAWRFEKEEHIILPLFETLLKVVEAHERPLSEKTKVVVNSLTTKIKVASLSLHKGLKLPDSFKSVAVDALAGNYSGALKHFFDTGTFTKEAKKKINEELVGEQKIGELLNPELLESIYLNIPEWIKRITLTENVNFIFLIDDLDRCLPENTLKMLESIKLFLDVPSCAFVLAVDDDVVERGVVHHYRDYLSIYHHKDTEDAKGVLQHELPITGHEYLEKMIQLPIRLPVIDTANVREFLKLHSQKWITLIDDKNNPGGLIPLPAKLSAALHKDKYFYSPSWELLDFFSKSIPPKPRKIKRTAKLFESKIELLHAMGLEGKCSYELLAKITLLELFAPNILRFMQNNDYAETYRALYDFHYVHDLKDKKKKNTLHDIKNIKEYVDQNDDYTREKKDRYNKLITMIGEHHSSRMVFDLGVVFTQREEYESLKVAIEYREATILDTSTKERLDDALLDSEMMEQLFLENNPETWGATLRAHKKVLSDIQVKRLISEASKKKDSQFNNLPFIVNPEWVGQVSKFVDVEDYKILLNASHDERFKVFDEGNKKQIDSFQLTFAEYDKYCEITDKEKPKDSGWGRGRRPVISVSWNDASKYIDWLNNFFGEDSKYALPTKAEWEFACSQGKESLWHFGDNEQELKEYAWYGKNFDGENHSVGSLKPNALGCYDMHGNVWEWCKDWYNKDENTKVLKGGSGWNIAMSSLTASTAGYNLDGSGRGIGFRLLRTKI